ncbi:hypothetical protein CMO92_00565 [Candidatus Woesearchaeota archaeon]|nr:hypothetical protein [Candidatus Woesearchaeota archaeon]
MFWNRKKNNAVLEDRMKNVVGELADTSQDRPVEADSVSEKPPKSRKETKLLERIKISEQFSDRDYSALRIWEELNRLGTIETMCEASYFSDKEEKPALMRRSDEGVLYPIEGVVEAKIYGAHYSLVLKEKMDSGLEVTIEFDSRNLSLVEDILKKAQQKVVCISRSYMESESLGRLYEILQEEARSVKFLRQGNSSSPKMSVDSEQRIVPVDAKMRVVLGEDSYLFKFSDQYGIHGVDVTCSVDKVDYVQDILSMAEDKAKEGEIEVKSVDFSISVANYHWGLVGGLGDARRELQQYLEWPLENPELFDYLDTTLPKGILLIGPPGNGKTTIAKIIANESQSAFYSVSPKDIYSMWLGNSEKNWGWLFGKTRKDVRDGKTAIVFIDEIDGFYTNRDEMDKHSRKSFGQFCQEVDGISDLNGVVILGATNRDDQLDPALVRRFPRQIYIGNPDQEGRGEILGLYTVKKPLADSVDVNSLVQRSDGFSGAMLKDLCDAATFNGVERYSETHDCSIKDIRGDRMKDVSIEMWDFEKALAGIKQYEENRSK